ncbi:zip zinc transporter domain-containing protein [Cyclospora cayetanensis]|uniref:Zip zinc transporter domain-containing protein n=1 Tax=Cyclospora cayetanensis TaxID=88456 RepID=A0A1D3D1T0_9EIME|nr:zip zinc transporter domain-containing protein [Cyclospora cayetanensis]
MISWRGAAAAAAAAVAAGSVPLRALAHPSHTEQPQQQQQAADNHDKFPVWASKLLAVGSLVLVSAAGAALPFYLQRKVVAAHEPEHEEGSLFRGPRRNEASYNGSGALPVRPRRPESWIQVTLVFLNCFACGAFLGLGLLHLMPEAVSQLEASGVVLRLGHGDHEHPYNAAYVLAAAGLTLMLIMEQMCSTKARAPFPYPLGALLSTLLWLLQMGTTTKSDAATLLSAGRRGGEQQQEVDAKAAIGEGAYSKWRGAGDAASVAAAPGKGSAVTPAAEKHSRCERSNSNANFKCLPCEPTVVIITLLTDINFLRLSLCPTFWKVGEWKEGEGRRGSSALSGRAIVVGMTRTTGDVWISTLAILGHKGAEAVALSSALLKARTSGWVKLACLFVFVMATPIGVLIGVFIAWRDACRVRGEGPFSASHAAVLCIFEDVSGASAAVATVLERSHLRHLHYDPSTRHVVHHHDEEYQNLPRALTGAADAGARANASASTP